MIEINRNKWGDAMEDEIIEKMKDEYRVQTDINPYQVPGFLAKKGALEVILLLADGPKTFEKLDDLSTVSRSTVSNRLTEASKIALVGQDTIYIKGDKKVRPYRLGIMGLICVEKANESGISKIFEKLYDARVEYRNKLPEFENRIDSEFAPEEEEEPNPELEALFSEYLKNNTRRNLN